MSDRSILEETLLVEALALPADTRSAFIKSRCGRDDDTARRMMALLHGYEDNSAFLEISAPAATLQSTGRSLVASQPEPQPGDRINRYHLLEKIGEGGFGVVYLAEQEQPVRRRVALKVIRLGLDTREFIARFEMERQALALMDHPNIARVYDAGATDQGRPYLVMELICGVPITTYADSHTLSIEARITLFMQVCSAIQHAHQKGVIHRDLKPSNILIELQGRPENGCPKVIDFGIAKATSEPKGEKTFYTRFQALLGTPAYTSPEQMDLSGLDVDTRTDVYSLGVLLYELLVGRQPFDRHVLERASLEEMRRIIREVDPPKPSARVGLLNEVERRQVAENRAMKPDKLSALLRHDLDWIVLRCLEKDRTRRYETANALAMDLRRYLENEPVVARPPSRLYQVKKFVRRNRTGVIAAALVVIVLLTGVVVSSIGFGRARVQQRTAESTRREAEDLVSFMVRDLKPELQRVGRLPLTAQVAERAVRYFTALPPDLKNASTERNRAVAFEALAYVRSMEGSKDLTASLWHEALQARRRAVGAAPGDPLLTVELALTEFVEVAHQYPLIAAQVWGARSPEIDQQLDKILQRARQAWHNRGAGLEVSLIFARVLMAESGYLNARMIRPTEALSVGREAEALFRDFLARNPDDTALGAELVRMMVANSIAAQQNGDIDGGIKVGEEALLLIDRTLEKNPGNIDLRETAAFTATQLSYRLQDATMERAGAAEVVARERWRVLMQMDPRNFYYRHAFADAHQKEAEFLCGAGRKNEAAAIVEQFLSLIAPVASTPDDFIDLQLGEARMGAFAAQFGHNDVAREHLGRVHQWQTKYIASLTPEAARQPTAKMYYFESQCIALEQLSDWPELERQARACVDACEPLSEHPELKGDASIAKYFLGRALLHQGRPEKALSILQGATQELGRMDAQHCSDGIVQGTLLTISVPFAEALIATGDVPQARGVLEKNLVVGEALVNAQPNRFWDIRAILSETEYLLATVLDRTDSKNAQRCQTLLQHAATVLENHIATNPLNIHESELLKKIEALSVTEHST